MKDLIEETIEKMEELERMNENSVPAIPPSYNEKKEDKPAVKRAYKKKEEK